MGEAYRSPFQPKGHSGDHHDMTNERRLRPVSPELTADIREIVAQATGTPGPRSTDAVGVVVDQLAEILQSVDANAHARGRAEAAAIVEGVFANVDELVEASSPGAEITVDQATVIRALLREALGAAEAGGGTAVRELAEAIRLTREYLGANWLPAAAGWSWYDALRKHAPDVLDAILNGERSCPPACGPKRGEPETNEEAGR